MDNSKPGKKEKGESPIKKSRTVSAPSSPFLTSLKTPAAPAFESSKRLEDARIIQRTLVYVINLPLSVSEESVLMSPLYFGKYGKILKIHITQGHHNISDPTFGAYLTYFSEEEAAVCIRACHEYVLDGKKLSLTFGTTKYCSNFLKNSRCPKSECVFLHHMASTADTIFREDMTNNKHIQPQDSIFDRIKVIISSPVSPSRLPEARIVRDRAISEIVESNNSPPQRSRLFSRDNTASRFPFTLDCGEKPLEVPVVIDKLRMFASPCKDIAIIPTKDIEEIFDPSSPHKWASDVIDVTPNSDTHVNAIVRKKT
jgi:RNA recognition motif-containing protein